MNSRLTPLKSLFVLILLIFTLAFDSMGQTWQSVASGDGFTIAIKSDGTLWAWGRNSQGQLGIGDTISTTVPVQVGNGSNWTQISAGRNHVLALRANKTVWGWGDNRQGQLGQGSTSYLYVPTQLTSGLYQAVASGWFHSLVLSTTGVVSSTGLNTDRQLGTFTTTNQDRFIAITTSGHKAIAAGRNHSLAISGQNRLFAWGNNDDGQLGLGDNNARLNPIQVGGASNWRSIAAGNGRSFASNFNSQILAFGAYNNTGSNSPQVLTLTNYNQNVSCFNETAFFFGFDASFNPRLFAIGDNSKGQYGDGTKTTANQPRLISTSSYIVSPGMDHTIFLSTTTPGILCASGNNRYGQLGIAGPSNINTLTCRSFSNGNYGLVASKMISDSRIELSWNIPVTEAHRSNNPEIYLQIRDYNTGKEVYAERIDSINNFSVVNGETQVFVEPGQSINYELRVIEYGPGTVLMDLITDVGQTLPFQEPDMSPSGLYPWSVDLNIDNHSDYAKKLYLYRDDSLIAVLDTGIALFSDVCNPLIPAAVVNGEYYTYRLQAINSVTQDTVEMTTPVIHYSYGVDFAATKEDTTGKVTLSWNDLSGRVDAIEVVKDGLTVAEYDDKATGFEDLTPIPGNYHQYQLKLYSGEELMITLLDSGSLRADGSISGYVFNSAEDGDFSIPGVQVLLTGTVNGKELARTVETDVNGYYEFEEVPYYTGTEFTIATSANSDDQTVSLDQDNNVASLNITGTVSSKELDKADFEVLSFEATPVDSLGIVQINWEIDQTDTVHYFIYRGDKLIVVNHQVSGTNSFTDTEGTPLISYEYSIRAYSRTFNSGTGKFDYKFADASADSAKFPYPYAIPQDSLTLLARSGKGTLELQWSYPDGNIDGFNIYRNDSLLATISPNERSYVDLTGANTEDYTYSMNCFSVIENDKTYNSSKTFTNTETYPKLKVPTGIASSNTAQKFPEITWKYNVAADYNYTGFYVLRTANGNTDTIARIRKSLPFSFIDKYGIPRQQYDYSVLAYKDNLLSTGNPGTAVSVPYPDLPAIKYADAYGGTEGVIRFYAEVDTNFSDYKIAIQSKDRSVTYDMFPAYSYGHTIPWNSYSNETIDFKLCLVKTIDTAQYFGNNTKLVSVTISENGPYALDTVTNLTASTNYSSHVMVSWDYPNYYVGEFWVYRDGYPIAKLDGVHKVYYDHQVFDNEPHVYQVQVIVDSRKSRRVGTIGQRAGNGRVIGSTYSKEGYKGIEGSKITLYTPGPEGETFYFGETTTDATGYYEFNNVPLYGIYQGYSLKVVASNPNARFEQSVKYLTKYDSVLNYVADFIDTLPNKYIPEPDIADPIEMIAISNDQGQSVDIHWQASNANYTSFEVYRGLVKIATVQSNQTKIVIDNGGTPGYDYSYRIRAIWQKDQTTKEEGEYFTVVQRFPAILPVENLQANQFNDAIVVNWSHPTDINLDYIVLRNGDFFRKVLSGEPLEVLDTLGTAGAIYKYSVTPVLSTDENVAGQELSVTAIFPSVSKIKTFTSSSTPNGVKLTWVVPTNRPHYAFLYCNGVVVDTFGLISNAKNGSPGIYNFDGIPETMNQYAIQIGYERDGVMYKGKKTYLQYDHPALRMPLLTAKAVGHAVKMDATSLYNAVSESGIEFWNLTTDSLLGSVSYDYSKNWKYTFTDLISLPETQYSYSARLYWTRGGIKYYSPFTPGINVTYPKLAAPQNVVAQLVNGKLHQVKWDYQREDVTFKVARVDGCGSVQPLMDVAGNLRLIKDEGLITDHRYSYSVQAQLVANGITYYSAATSSNEVLGNGKALISAGNDGYGITNNSITFTETEARNDRWIDIVSGNNFVVALRDDGTLWAWGANVDGQLGIGNTTNQSSPVQVGTDNDWESISAFIGYSAAAIKKNGTLWVWGDGGYGQLAQGNQNDYTSPVQVGSDSDWMYVHMGPNSLLAIKDDGTLWGAGYANFSSFQRNLYQIGTDKNWVKVESGHRHAIALKKNGTIWGWGTNTYGQLGMGHTNVISTPTRIGSLSGWKDFSVGGYHTMFLRSNTYLYAAGLNSSGQFGDGTNTNSSSMKYLGYGVCNVYCGSLNTYVSTGAWVAATGSNAYGQLGNNTTTTRNTWAVIGYYDKMAPSQYFTIGLENIHNLVNNFSATDGEFGTKVYLEWSDASTKTNIDKLRIYRDGELISIEDKGKTNYSDLDAVPGMKHVYTISIEETGGNIRTGVSDIGWRQPAGVVKGNVITFVGNQPVPDVDIDLKVETDEGNFYYKTKTDNSGRFRFENVYYGKRGDVYASASYPGHEFVVDTLTSELDLTIASLGVGTFIDKSANLISGTLTNLDSDCPIDSIPVTLVKHYGSSDDVEELNYTDAGGGYSFSVNPYETDLVSFEIVLPETNIRESDTIYHDWNQNNVIVDLSTVGVNTPAFDFVDNLSVPYKFTVQNACDIYPGIKFSLDIQSMDGCYQKTLISNDNGSFTTVDLPPLDYIVAVTGASPLESDIIPVLDYLSVRPKTIMLSDYGKNSKGDSTFSDLFSEKYQFTYHNIPDITLTKGGGIENIPCNPDILLVHGDGDGNVEAACTFKVMETHKGTTCHVQEGFLIVKNGATNGGDVTIPYDETIGGFPEYRFIPGLPETISPYYKTMSVEYHNSFGFVSQAVYQILVTGKAPQPGSDVIVSSEEGKDFQIPLAVLRDPPGDGSYSYLEKGVETTKSFSVDQEFGGSFTISGSTTLGIFGIGMEVNASAGVGGSDQNLNALTFSTSTTQRFETSAESDIQNSQGSEYFVGDNADLIVGTGMALKYGIIEKILYDPTTCTVTKQTEIGISPDKLSTTWAYTVTHIETLIAEYENLLKLVREGRVTIEDNSGGSEPKDSNFYRTLIDNWKGVLDYHRNKTIPHYNFCDKSILNSDFNTDDVAWGIPRTTAEKVKKAAQSFQEDCFCKVAGSYDKDDKFVLNSDFKWTDEIILKYRISRMRRAELYDYFQVLAGGIETGPGYTPPSLDEYNDNDDDWADKLTDGDKTYAENLTFSGQASIEKSFSNSVTNSSTYTQHIYGNASAYAGLLLISEFDVSTWAGLGAGVNVSTTPAIDVETRVGVEASFDFNIENQASEETTTTTTSGYVLSDDDPGDQFSVTVIKGIEDMHTPYFELFAGRSSCPYEPGTLARDRPEIQLEYPDGSPFENNVLRDLDIEDYGYFSLKLVNKAPETFNEYRYYNIVVAPNSNTNGADLRAFGSGAYYPVTYKVLSGGSTYAGMVVSFNGINYDYPDIKMQAIPTCLDAESDLADGFNGAEIDLEAYFHQPCSDISVLSPGENWRLTQSRDQFGNPAENILIQIGDYDPSNQYLETVSLRYRRVGSNVWTEMKGSKVTRDSLETYYNLYRTVYRDPVYNFVWDVLGNLDVIDGEYEIQAVANCGIVGNIYSNTVKGVIDRTALALYGVPKPEDGVLNIGENVEVVFSEPVECGYETKSRGHYQFVRKSDGAVLDFTPVCNGNSIIYNFDGDLDTLDGAVVQMSVFDVQDLNGNKLQDTVHHEFLVRNSPVSWQPYSFDIFVYKGESRLVDLDLVNTGAAKAYVDLTMTGSPTDLFILQTTKDSIFEGSRLSIPFVVDASNTDIGTYSYTVSADVSTFLKNYGPTDIPVTVTVLPQSPNWTAPGGKSMSTVVICNFELDSVRSVDTMDQIAITIGNEVRGVDNIYKSKAGSNLYYAVINVQGDAADIGKTLGYRIWDASMGAEYDGYMTAGDIKFDGGVYGTTISPRIIRVNSEWDSVRYIPLTQGWNWLAFNYQRTDLSVQNMLAGLDLTGGEVIKDLSKEAVWNSSDSSWFATSTGLSKINTASGYLLYLNKDDILRVSGKDADLKTVSVANGWTLIGNPYQSEVDINDAFVPNSDIEDGAILKTGGTVNKASVMEGGVWTGGITTYEVNQAYMLFNTKQTSIRYKKEELKPQDYEYNITFIGSILFDMAELRVDGDYVVAVIDGEIRGKGVLEEANVPNSRYIMNMFVYGDSADLGKEVKFRIYRQNTNQFYDAYTQDTIIFKPDVHKGEPNRPYWFSNTPEFLHVAKAIEGQPLTFRIYPNPHDNAFSIDLDIKEAGEAKIIVFDLRGRKVIYETQRCISGLNTIGISTDGLAEGSYTVWVQVNGMTKAEKVIKE